MRFSYLLLCLALAVVAASASSSRRDRLRQRFLQRLQEEGHKERQQEAFANLAAAEQPVNDGFDQLHQKPLTAATVDPHAHHRRPQTPPKQQQQAADPHAHHRKSHQAAAAPNVAPKLHHQQSIPTTPNPVQNIVRAADVGAENHQCKDSFGNTLQWTAGRPDLFQILVGGKITGSADFQVVTVSCPRGAIFDIGTCGCQLIPEDLLDQDQCHIYLPFNANLSDHSIHRFQTQLDQNSNHILIENRRPAAPGVSSGAARFDKKSALLVPGRIKATARMQIQAAWCALFRCDHGAGSKCQEDGGLISNKVDKRHTNALGVDTTFSLGVTGQNKVVAKLVYGEQAQDVVELEADLRFIDPTGQAFTQVCVTHDSVRDKLYVNKVLVATKPSLGKMLPVSGPYAIGHSRSLGHFKGLVDEVLVCDHAMQSEEIVAHHDTNKHFFQSRGYLPSDL